MSDNTIILNATGEALDSDGVNRFYVKPIAPVGGRTGFQNLKYNPDTGEIAYE